MTLIHALILGLVQGITEFVPVSSSGHLKLIEHFLGLGSGKELLGFDLCCHFGTLLATLVILRKDVWQLLTQKRKTLMMLIIAIVPLIPIYALLKGPIQSLFGKPELLWLAFLMTGGLLLVAYRRKENDAASWPKRESKRQALTIGLFQACALVPGLSRSGSTITAARLFGWKLSEAVRFSYLLAMPTIFGGMVLESRKMLTSLEVTSISLSHYLIGFFVSFIVGVITLRWFLRFVEKGRLYLFAGYCILLSIVCLLVFR